MALANLRICADLPEPSLLDNVIITKKNSCAGSYNTYIRRSQNKGTLVFLKEFSVVLQEEWQQISRAEIRHNISSMPDRCRTCVAA